jgi:predicted phosphodiesterase
LLLSCGPNVATPYEYFSNCVKVKSTVELTQAAVDFHIGETISWYDHKFLPGDWCRDIKNTNTEIIVVDGDFDCTAYSVGCAGFTEPGFIWINGRRRSILHESFHMRDLLYDTLDYINGPHFLWDKKGYWQASDNFKNNLFTIIN